MRLPPSSSKTTPVALITMLAAAVYLYASVAAQARLQDIELIKGLRAGSHVILMRHAQTDQDGFDRDPSTFKNIRLQQQLSDQGRRSAIVFGDQLRAIGVPVGEVVSSRFHRAVHTALLAKLTPVKPSADVTDGSLVASPNENRRRATALRTLIGASLPKGQNRLIITHRANIQNALGREWFDVREGEASIFKVDNSAYSLVARLQIDDWSRLVTAAASLDASAAAAAATGQSPSGAPSQNGNSTAPAQNGAAQAATPK